MCSGTQCCIQWPQNWALEQGDGHIASLMQRLHVSVHLSHSVEQAWEACDERSSKLMEIHLIQLALDQVLIQ